MNLIRLTLGRYTGRDHREEPTVEETLGLHGGRCQIRGFCDFVLVNRQLNCMMKSNLVHRVPPFVPGAWLASSRLFHSECVWFSSVSLGSLTRDHRPLRLVLHVAPYALLCSSQHARLL